MDRAYLALLQDRLKRLEAAQRKHLESRMHGHDRMFLRDIASQRAALHLTLELWSKSLMAQIAASKAED